MVDMAEPIISLRDVGVQFSRNRRRHRSLRELLLKGRATGTAQPASSGRSGTSASTSTRASRSASSDATGRASRRCSASSPACCIPDEGVVTVRAGVAPLIAITGGFEGELTARENIYLVAGLHGMSDAEIAEQLRRDRRLRRDPRLPRHPVQALLVGHEGAARVLGRVAAARADPARRRGARRRRQGVPHEVPPAHRRRCCASGQTLFLVSHSEGNLKRFCRAGSTSRAASCARTARSRTSSSSTRRTWAPGRRPGRRLARVRRRRLEDTSSGRAT